ncbi:MAG: ATPase, T2SS/T4P/T4SS family [Candidatus Micrarchaeota archaeon]
MACRPSYHGNRLSMDCLTCGLGLGTTSCIGSHIHTIAMLEKPWKTMRYEEENIIELDGKKSRIFSEYVGIIRQVEALMANPKIYGHPEDDQYNNRKNLIKDFYETIFQNPVQAARVLEDYSEPQPTRSVFLKGHHEFAAWVNGILDAYKKTMLYQISSKHLDLRKTFLSILSLKTMPYTQAYIKSIPENTRLVEGGTYSLKHGIEVDIYKIPGNDSLLYVQKNPAIENLSDELSSMLKEAVLAELKQTRENVDYTTIFEEKVREFRQQFLDDARAKSLPLTPPTAFAMGREAAAWSVGLGSPIENIALDRKNITDIYIDAQSAALYVEHQEFGLCHTLWQYNREMLDRMFRNIVATQKGTRRFDKDNPIIDVVLTRLAMRCHLQRPPATFGDLQAALRIMKDEPFTYPEYLKYNSFTPFFAGYDDVLVGLGCSEAVLGLKGVGKTAFTEAKIAAIGLKRRILPIQDIEEIPVRAYRKRGFHIGAVRVISSDRDDVPSSSSELDLVSMTNAALRMGDACVIINEIRWRTAIQGVINMLNTQPGIFLLYNLHAQSLKDIQDRLELVFGMPAASMYSTDRYSFLKKIRFGRKSRMFRLLGSQFESDMGKRQFVPVFTLERGNDISSTNLICNFCSLPEASSKQLYNIDLGEISKKLKLKFTPPALKRRCEETGLPPEDYVMEAFYKGKLYDLIYRASIEHSEPLLIEIDFVLKCLAAANNILHKYAGETPDWAKYDKLMCEKFNEILQKEISDLETTAIETGQRPASQKQKSSVYPQKTTQLKKQPRPQETTQIQKPKPSILPQTEIPFPPIQENQSIPTPPPSQPKIKIPIPPTPKTKQPQTSSMPSRPQTKPYRPSTQTKSSSSRAQTPPPLPPQKTQPKLPPQPPTKSKTTSLPFTIQTSKQVEEKTKLKKQKKKPTSSEPVSPNDTPDFTMEFEPED